VAIRTPTGESLSRLHRRLQREAGPQLRRVDWLDPAHFSVVVTAGDSGPPPSTLSGFVRRFRGGKYEFQPGPREYCGLLTTHLAEQLSGAVRVLLLYRHIPLRDEPCPEGVPAELEYWIDPDAELRPLLSELAVNVTSAATGEPLGARVNLRRLDDSAGVTPGQLTDEDGSIVFTNRVPGFSIVEVTPARTDLEASERWSISRIVHLPPGEVAPTLSFAVHEPLVLGLKGLDPDGNPVAFDLRWCRLHEDFPRPLDVGDRAGFYVGNAHLGLALAERGTAVLLTARATKNEDLAAAPIVLDAGITPAGDLPLERVFQFQPAARLHLRVEQERIPAHLAVLLDTEGRTAWSKRIEGPGDTECRVVPGEYTLVVFARAEDGTPIEKLRRGFDLSTEESNFVVP
jgi:hypothetical protein